MPPIGGEVAGAVNVYPLAVSVSGRKPFAILVKSVEQLIAVPVVPVQLAVNTVAP